MRQTDHPHFTGDIRNVHDLQLTYGTYASNGRHTECSHFMVDIQGMSALWKMVRTPKMTKHRQQVPKCDWNQFSHSFSSNLVVKKKNPNFNMENQNPRVPPLWEYSLTTLLGHDPTSDPGIALRQWVLFQGV